MRISIESSATGTLINTETSKHSKLKGEKEMGIVTKEGYERKREWAANRMAENRELTTLSEEQHDALEELCTFRHELHIDWNSAFFSGSGSFAKYIEELSTYGENPLSVKINSLFGEMPFTPADYPCDDDALEEADAQGLGYDEEGDKKRNEIFENAKWEAYGIFSNINEQIESFLLKIDRKHGTNYCPSGATRL